MAVSDKHIAPFVFEVPFQAARLGTCATVCGTISDELAKIALSAERDTQGTMDKELQRHLCLLPDCLYLIDAQFAGKNNLFKSHIFKKLDLFCRSVMALCRGVKSDRRHRHFQKSHILNYEGIYTSVPAVPSNRARLL